MKKGILLTGILSLLLIALAGCETFSTEDSEPLKYAPVTVHPSKTLTLPKDQLLALDWHSPHRRGGRIENKRSVAGSGVEFDIYFPSNHPSDNEVTYVSSGEGGLGTLAGSNIEGYERFALKFTLVSINGKTGAPEIGKKLILGALIGPTSTGRLRTYQPVTLSLDGTEKTAVSTTNIRTKKIYQIGFHAIMKNPSEWTDSPALVRLRVEPVDNAGKVPEMILIDPDDKDQ